MASLSANALSWGGGGGRKTKLKFDKKSYSVEKFAAASTGARFAVVELPAGLDAKAPQAIAKRVGKEEDPTGTAALPIGWRVVAVEDSVVANKLQLTTAIEALGPKQRIAVTVHPATEHAKMCAVATKWQAIHRGRQARNPPPAIQSDDSDEELEAQKELGLLVRSPRLNQSQHDIPVPC